MEENASNLTSAFGDRVSASSSNKAETGPIFPHRQYFAQICTPPIARKKRNVPGNPDLGAEVIVLSPEKDQNLQLHRRGHNRPWVRTGKVHAPAFPTLNPTRGG
ncbi:hypothetical protein U1Q18_018704 [Sarracenia purpurea var. burkii]